MRGPSSGLIFAALDGRLDVARLRKTMRSPDEARAFLKWIDQFELLLRGRDRFPTPKVRQQALDQIDAARAVYARIVREARE